MDQQPKLVSTIDPRVDYSEHTDAKYLAVKPSQSVTYSVQPNSSKDVSNIVFNVPSPSSGTAISRRVLLRCHLRLTWAGTLAQSTILADRDALRAFPISSCIETCNVTLNTQNFSCPVAQVVHPLSRFYSYNQPMATVFSESPCTPDTLQSYDNGGGTVINPLAGYTSASPAAPKPRGAFPAVVSFTRAAAAPLLTTVYDVVVTEAVMVSPLMWTASADDSLGLYGINNLTIAFNTRFNNGKQVWSHLMHIGDAIDATGFQAPTVSFSKEPELLFTYLTPPQSMSIPKTLFYPLFNVQPLSSAAQEIGAGTVSAPQAVIDAATGLIGNGSADFISPNINLTSVPSALYIFVKQDDSKRRVWDTDTYLSLSDLSIQFNNKTGILAGASQQHLYDISRKNGLSMSFQDFTGLPQTAIAAIPAAAAAAAYSPGAGGVGSIIKLKMEDLGLDESWAPGSKIACTLQVQVKALNTCPYALTPKLTVLVVSEGYMSITDGNITQHIGAFSQSDVLLAPHVPTSLLEANDRVFGAGFGDSVSNFFRNTIPEMYQKYGPIVKDVAKVLMPALGGRALIGGTMVGGALVGGSSDEYGGARSLSRKLLKSRIKG